MDRDGGRGVKDFVRNKVTMTGAKGKKRMRAEHTIQRIPWHYFPFYFFGQLTTHTYIIYSRKVFPFDFAMLKIYIYVALDKPLH